MVITSYKITLSVGDSGSHTFPFFWQSLIFASNYINIEYSIDTVITHIMHFTQVFFFSKMQRNNKTAISVTRHTNLVFNTKNWHATLNNGVIITSYNTVQYVTDSRFNAWYNDVIITSYKTVQCVTDSHLNAWCNEGLKIVQTLFRFSIFQTLYYLCI